MGTPCRAGRRWRCAHGSHHRSGARGGVLDRDRRVPLADWGYAVLLEQAVVAAPRGSLGKRVFASAVHIHLTAAHAGLPAGADITIGYAEASASALTPPAASAPASTRLALTAIAVICSTCSGVAPSANRPWLPR